MTVHLATWFHGDDATNPGRYAQMLGDSSSRRHWRVYARCALTLLTTARVENPTASLLLAMNVDPNRVFTPDEHHRLDTLGIDVCVIPNTHKLPASYADEWQNQFFLIDVLRLMSDRAVAGDSVVVLDSDCIINRPLGDLDDEITSSGIVRYDLPYRGDHVVHGLPVAALGRIASTFRTSVPVDVPYSGGEFVGVGVTRIGRLLRTCEELFDWSMREFEAGATEYFREEAQLLSVAYAIEGGAGGGGHWIRRIWTQPWTMRDAAHTDCALAIWHLPAEKRTSLMRVATEFDRLVWGGADNTEVVRNTVARHVPVPRYLPRHAVLDLPHMVRGVGRRIRRRLGPAPGR